MIQQQIDTKVDLRLNLSMKSITVKQLRQQMQEVIKDIEENRSQYQVTLRSKPVFQLNPVRNHENFMKALQKVKGTAQNKDIPKDPAEDKKYLRNMMKKKYGLE